MPLDYFLVLVVYHDSQWIFPFMTMRRIYALSLTLFNLRCYLLMLLLVFSALFYEFFMDSTCNLPTQCSFIHLCNIHFFYALIAIVTYFFFLFFLCFSLLFFHFFFLFSFSFSFSYYNTLPRYIHCFTIHPSAWDVSCPYIVSVDHHSTFLPGLHHSMFTTAQHLPLSHT
jgi:hypothetical protein